MEKIVLIEDDAVLCETLAYILEHEGYAVLAASDGVAGIELARSCRPDLILLDVMLPRLDGFSICRMLRRESIVPILMLTTRRDEVDQIAGFEIGADDYVVKPFSLAELMARVRAALRRSRRHLACAEFEQLIAGDLKVDLASWRAYRGEHELKLTQKEFDLLVCLMRNRGVALSRDLLVERVWGYDYEGDSRTVDVHVHWLREKVEADLSQPSVIVTVRGIGYRFEPTITAR